MSWHTRRQLSSFHSLPSCFAAAVGTRFNAYCHVLIAYFPCEFRGTYYLFSAIAQARRHTGSALYGLCTIRALSARTIRTSTSALYVCKHCLTRGGCSLEDSPDSTPDELLLNRIRGTAHSETLLIVVRKYAGCALPAAKNHIPDGVGVHN